MIRRHATEFRLALMSADLLSAVFLFGAVSVLRFGGGWQDAWQRLGAPALVVALAYGVVWVIALLLQGLYRPRARWRIRSEALDIFRSVILIAVAVFTVLYVVKLPDVSRLFLLILLPAQGLLTLVSRITLRGVFAIVRERGMNARFMLVVGTGPEAQDFADRVEGHADLGLRVIGHLATDGVPPGDLRRPVLGTLDQIEDILHREIVDEVAVCLPPESLARGASIARLCEEEGKIVRIPITGHALTIPGGRVEAFDGIEVLSLVYGPDRAFSLLLKRLVDIALAIVALVVLAPVFIVLAILIRLLDGPPVLFRQVRVGLHGRPFHVVKFRTMAPDAEQRLSELEELNEIRGLAFKITDDPRVTRMGRVLRATSLDELPQLWNVLRGQMSIVGPRPPLPSEVAAYDLWHRRRLSMKPGITGLWQVMARREQEFDRWVSIDLDYIDSWSLWLDIKIMFRTIPAMLAREGR